MKIAILPGDGIGPEIMDQAVKVLNALGEPFEMETAQVGGAGYAAHGHPLPEGTLKLAKEADAVLFGAVGDYKYDTLERALRPEQAILGLRRELGLFANLRPAILYPELAGASTLKPEVVSGLDILIIRELTGDIYFGKPRGVRECPDGPFAGQREGFVEAFAGACVVTAGPHEPEVELCAPLGFAVSGGAREGDRAFVVGPGPPEVPHDVEAAGACLEQPRVRLAAQVGERLDRAVEVLNRGAR